MKTMMTLIRMAALATVGLTAVAISIGLAMEQPEAFRVPERRALMFLPRDEMSAMRAGASWFVDPSVGRLEPVRLPEGDHLELATVSPWGDERGRRQVVGRWAHRQVDKDGAVTSRGSGIARYSYPDGKPLDYVAMETMPLGPPSWAPGTEARVVFTGGDGVIYSVSFEEDPDQPARTPIALTADPGMPWGVDVSFGNLDWPDDPRFGGRLIVALRRRDARTRRFSAPEIWWLSLDPTGLRIIDAGRMTEEDPTVVNEQYPVVAAAADGSPRLAFLTGSDERTWQLAVAAVDFDPATGRPQAGRPEIVAEGCFFSRPAISADGSWVSCVVRGRQTELLPHRVALGALPPTNAYAVRLPVAGPAL